ncbi:hypothetical protein CISG_07698 [Coccidioides immitis RMSCC 3703]|uniref:Uncharacterized protein n=1 Tax=Coccidioides immitis RMSCC 3703 TaxID=454286 RepID=A0A0J8TZ42_COCIT|nr:hypothetical protein CISG_07698 [Coccidioides immitis RMSCC 3703]
MFQLSSLVQKAQSLVDAANFGFASTGSSDRNPSKGSLFRQQFRLPDSQNPLQEITAELVLPVPYSSSSASSISSATQGERPRDVGRVGNTYPGNLHLSERFLCFSTQPTSFLPSAVLARRRRLQDKHTGLVRRLEGLTLPLCSIRRVERLNSLSHVFSLALTTWNGALVKGSGKDAQATPQRFTLHLVVVGRLANGLQRLKRD